MWTMMQDLSCLPSGALRLLWVLECSQESGASPTSALTLKVLQRGDNLMAVLSFHLLLFLSSFHSTVEQIQWKKTENAMTNVAPTAPPDKPVKGLYISIHDSSRFAINEVTPA